MNTFAEIDKQAYEQYQKLTKNVKEKLDNTKYQLTLNHKQILLIKNYIENKDGTERTEDEFDLLDVLVTAKEVRQK